jgi:hypothetical protein
VSTQSVSNVAGRNLFRLIPGNTIYKIRDMRSRREKDAEARCVIGVGKLYKRGKFHSYVLYHTGDGVCAAQVPDMAALEHLLDTTNYGIEIFNGPPNDHQVENWLPSEALSTK